MKFILLFFLCILASCTTTSTDVLVHCDSQETTRNELRLLYQATHVKSNQKNYLVDRQVAFAKEITIDKIIQKLENKEKSLSTKNKQGLLSVARATVLKDMFIDYFTQKQELEKIPFYLIQFLFIKNGTGARKKADQHLDQLNLMKNTTDQEIDQYIAKNSNHETSRVTGGRVPWFYADDIQNPYHHLLSKVILLPKRTWHQQLVQTPQGFFLVRLLDRKDLHMQDRGELFLDYFKKTQKITKKICTKMPQLRQQANIRTQPDPIKESLKHAEYISTSYALHKLIAFNSSLLTREGVSMEKNKVYITDKDRVVLTYNNNKITVRQVVLFLTYNPALNTSFTDNKGIISPFFLQFACLSYLLAEEASRAGLAESAECKKRVQLEYARVISRAYLERKKPEKNEHHYLYIEKENLWKLHNCTINTGKLEDGAI